MNFRAKVMRKEHGLPIFHKCFYLRRIPSKTSIHSMSLWNKIFGAKNKTIIKRSYKLGNYIIQLQESPIAFSGSRTSKIVAYDEQGNIKWVAENPHADFVYHDMQVDEGSNTVIGDAGTGRIYEIELMTGKIIRSSLVK